MCWPIAALRLPSAPVEALVLTLLPEADAGKTILMASHRAENLQELRQHRRRPTKTGVVSMFSGLLYCADCGGKLGYSATNNYKREQAYFFCSSYRKNSSVCSAHYIRERIVEQLVLEGLQRLFWYIQAYEVRFATLSMAYEAEQRELKAKIPKLEAALDSASDKADDLQKFIDRAKRITRLAELTPELVHEFIEKIVVSKPEKVDGKRRQRVDIYYSTIGLWVAPDPEELEREYLAYYKSIQKRKKKTA